MYKFSAPKLALNKNRDVNTTLNLCDNKKSKTCAHYNYITSVEMPTSRYTLDYASVQGFIQC